MLIIKTDYLTDNMLDSLTDLILDVNEFDKAKYAAPDDADYYAMLYDDGEPEVIVPEEIDPDELDPDALRAVIALYEMGETHGGRTVIELSAFTSPTDRRQGHFKKLMASLDEELSDFAVRFAVYKNGSNLKVLDAIGAVFDHDEQMMALLLKDGIYADVTGFDADISIEEVHTEEGDYEEGSALSAYGECSFRLYKSRAYVYGVLTYDSCKRKGYAWKLMTRLAERLMERGLEEITIEVSSDNVPAVKLYEKLGFRTVDRLSYFYVLK